MSHFKSLLNASAWSAVAAAVAMMAVPAESFAQYRNDQRSQRNDRQVERRGDNRGDRSRDQQRDTRRDGRRDAQRDGRRDTRRDNRRDVRRDARRDGRRWEHNWRRNNRYDWQDYRRSHRQIYRLGRYHAPYRNYHYRRLGIGFFLDSLFFSSRYWINDPWYYRLPPAYGPYRWVRYYNDALLVDRYTGEVVDVIYDVFW